MKTLVQALRAVVVETLGVVMVVGMLYGTAGWTLESTILPEDGMPSVLGDCVNMLRDLAEAGKERVAERRSAEPRFAFPLSNGYTLPAS